MVFIWEGLTELVRAPPLACSCRKLRLCDLGGGLNASEFGRGLTPLVRVPPLAAAENFIRHQHFRIWEGLDRVGTRPPVVAQAMHGSKLGGGRPRLRVPPNAAAGSSLVNLAADSIYGQLGGGRPRWYASPRHNSVMHGSVGRGLTALVRVPPLAAAGNFVYVILAAASMHQNLGGG